MKIRKFFFGGENEIENDSFRNDYPLICEFHKKEMDFLDQKKKLKEMSTSLVAGSELHDFFGEGV